MLLGQQAAETDIDPEDYIVEQLCSGELRFAYKDPSAPENFPRILCLWRTNPLGSSTKDTGFLLCHIVGAGNDVDIAENPSEQCLASVTWHDETPVGKFGLMRTADSHDTSTIPYSDIVLPVAIRYEKRNISSIDIHPLVHSFSAAIDPPWEAYTDFQVFQTLVGFISAWVLRYLGIRTDVVAVFLTHDTPNTLAMAHDDMSSLPQE